MLRTDSDNLISSAGRDGGFALGPCATRTSGCAGRLAESGSRPATGLTNLALGYGRGSVNHLITPQLPESLPGLPPTGNRCATSCLVSPPMPHVRRSPARPRCLPVAHSAGNRRSRFPLHPRQAARSGPLRGASPDLQASRRNGSAPVLPSHLHGIPTPSMHTLGSQKSLSRQTSRRSCSLRLLWAATAVSSGHARCPAISGLKPARAFQRNTHVPADYRNQVDLALLSCQ